MKNVNDMIVSNMLQLFDNMNKRYFERKHIVLSTDINHAVDRIKDRKLDEVEVLKDLSSVLRNYVCQIIFYAYLEDRPLRLNIETKKFVFGFSIKVAKTGTMFLTLRTIINNYKTRPDSRISTFFIKATNEY